MKTLHGSHSIYGLIPYPNILLLLLPMILACILGIFSLSSHGRVEGTQGESSNTELRRNLRVEGSYYFPEGP